MKKVITTLTLALFTMLALAQEHLEFKGIPLDGTTATYVQKLTKSGFKHEGKVDGDEVFSGTFTGKECTVFIESTPVTNTVHTAYVVLKEQSDWATLKADYSLLKKGLTTKYGEPRECVEEINDYFKDGDGHEYLAFSNGKAKWYADYRTSLGTISLYIREQNYSKLTVIVRYVDAKNSEKGIRELTADL